MFYWYLNCLWLQNCKQSKLYQGFANTLSCILTLKFWKRLRSSRAGFVLRQDMKPLESVGHFAILAMVFTFFSTSTGGLSPIGVKEDWLWSIAARNSPGKFRIHVMQKLVGMELKIHCTSFSSSLHQAWEFGQRPVWFKTSLKPR